MRVCVAWPGAQQLGAVPRADNSSLSTVTKSASGATRLARILGLGCHFCMVYSAPHLLSPAHTHVCVHKRDSVGGIPHASSFLSKRRTECLAPVRHASPYFASCLDMSTMYPGTPLVSTLK